MYILLAFMVSYIDGSRHSSQTSTTFQQEFKTRQGCEVALQAVTSLDRRFKGVCVKK